VQYIDNFDCLIKKYKLFLFDQFGVLHNGAKPYAGMVQVLEKLKQNNKTVAVISNSGKRANVNAQRITGFGYGDDLIDHVYTSGEIAWLRLKKLTLNHTATNPLTVFYLGNDNDRSALEGLPIIETDTPALADLIIIGGVGLVSRTESDYEQLFREAVVSQIPAYCTNPDMLSFYGSGSVKTGPGRIAQIYVALGGRCEFFGKPHKPIYCHILNDLSFSTNETICIGDSLEHDVLGAGNAGCDSVLVRTGIHENLTERQFIERLQSAPKPPTYILER